MIERNAYLSKLISVRENGFPKIITGIRRCGKSFLLKEIFKKYLLSTGVKEEQIIIIELDELKNTKYRNPFELDIYIPEKNVGIDLISTATHSNIGNYDLQRKSQDCEKFGITYVALMKQNNIDSTIFSKKNK